MSILHEAVFINFFENNGKQYRSVELYDNLYSLSNLTAEYNTQTTSNMRLNRK